MRCTVVEGPGIISTTWGSLMCASFETRPILVFASIRKTALARIKPDLVVKSTRLNFSHLWTIFSWLLIFLIFYFEDWGFVTFIINIFGTKRNIEVLLTSLYCYSKAKCTNVAPKCCVVLQTSCQLWAWQLYTS